MNFYELSEIIDASSTSERVGNPDTRNKVNKVKVSWMIYVTKVF